MSAPQKYPAENAFHMQAEAAAMAMQQSQKILAQPQPQHHQLEQQQTVTNNNNPNTTIMNNNHNNNNNNNPHQPRYAATGGITLPVGTIIPGRPVPPRVGGRPAPSPPRIESPPLPEPIGNAAAASTAMEGEGLWSCHKCDKSNLDSKVRCSSCQAWRGGKRESYKHKKQGFLPPQFPWTCPCGNENKPAKVRCSKCQRWKGGKRMHNNEGNIASTWLYAQQIKIIEANVQDKMDDTTSNKPNTVQQEEAEEWKCDKCDNINHPTKVRCQSCPRWKNGKRPKHGKKELMRLMQDEMTAQGIAMSTATIMAATAAAKASTGSIKFAWPKQLADTTGVQPSNNGNWFCMGCNHMNQARKARCGSCQRWKFGKRENMKKKNRPTTAMNKMKPTTTALPAAYKATLAAAVVGEMKAPPTAPVPVPALEVDTHDRQNIWACPCGRTNLPDKSRCSSCQKWKGGKRGSMPRKQKSEKADSTAGVFAMTLPPLAKAVPNQPNIPWRCAGCGTSNGYRKLRCVGCQSWKNGKKQLSQRTEAVRTEAAAVAQSVQLALADPPIHEQYREAFQKDQEQQKIDQERQRHAARAPALKDADGTLHCGDWNCHGCKARVPGVKQRCPNCKCWKLGHRANLKTRKPKPKHWVCQGCKKYNEGERVRCHACWSWRDGKRRELKLTKPDWTCDICNKENKASKARCGECHRWKGGQRLNMRKEQPGVQRKRQLQQPAHQNQAVMNVPAQMPPVLMPIASQIPDARGQPPMIAAAVNMTAQNLVATDALQNLVLFGQAPITAGGANTNMPGIAHPPALPSQVPTNAATSNIPGHHQIGQAPAKVETPGIHHPAALPAQEPLTIAAVNNIPEKSQIGLVEAPQITVPLAPAEQNNKAGKRETGENNIWTCTKCTCDNAMSDEKCKICDSSRDGWDGEDV